MSRANQPGFLVFWYRSRSPQATRLGGFHLWSKKTGETRPSREAAQECSPRRQPWVPFASRAKPRRGDRAKSCRPSCRPELDKRVACRYMSRDGHRTRRPRRLVWAVFVSGPRTRETRPSREAAQECSPRRLPWVPFASRAKPRRGDRDKSRGPHLIDRSAG